MWRALSYLAGTWSSMEGKWHNQKVILRAECRMNCRNEDSSASQQHRWQMIMACVYLTYIFKVYGDGFESSVPGTERRKGNNKTLHLKFIFQQLVSKNINRTESELVITCLPIKWKQIADFNLLILWMTASLSTILSNWDKQSFHRMPAVYQSALAWGSRGLLVEKSVSVVDNFHIIKDLLTSLVRLLDNNFIILNLYPVI